MGLMLFMMLAVPCIGAAVGWLLLSRVFRPLGWVGGILIGIAPMTLFAWSIYQGEKGGGDPDPLFFLQLSIAVSSIITFSTIVGLEYARLRR
jgi:hypothetical protein